MSVYCTRDDKDEDEIMKSIKKILQQAKPIHGYSIFGVVSEKWTDAKYLELLQKAKWYDLDLSNSKNVMLHLLRFFVTGNNEISIPSLLDFVISSLEWFPSGNVGKSFSPVKELMNTRNITSSSHSVPEPLDKNALLQEFNHRLAVSTLQQPGSTGTPTYHCLLSISGLTVASKEELDKRVKQYYDLIEFYFDDRNAFGADAKKASQATSLIRSLYTLILLICRARAKNGASIKEYILTGKYLTLAKTISNCGQALVFDINPITSGFENALLIMSQTSFSTNNSILILVGISCAMRDGISDAHVVSSEGTPPQSIKNPLACDKFTDNPALYNFLKGGCLLHLRYKGLAIVKIIEDLSRVARKPVLDLLNQFSTNVTYGACKAIMEIFMAFSENWERKSPNEIVYNSPQSTWRFAKNFSNNVFPEISAKTNRQFYWRIVQVYASRVAVDSTRITVLAHYEPNEADLSWVAKNRELLFESRRIEVQDFLDQKPQQTQQVRLTHDPQ